MPVRSPFDRCRREKTLQRAFSSGTQVMGRMVEPTGIEPATLTETHDFSCLLPLTLSIPESLPISLVFSVGSPQFLPQEAAEGPSSVAAITRPTTDPPPSTRGYTTFPLRLRCRGSHRSGRTATRKLGSRPLVILSTLITCEIDSMTMSAPMPK